MISVNNKHKNKPGFYSKDASGPQGPDVVQATTIQYLKGKTQQLKLCELTEHPVAGDWYNMYIDGCRSSQRDWVEAEINALGFTHEFFVTRDRQVLFGIDIFRVYKDIFNGDVNRRVKCTELNIEDEDGIRWFITHNISRFGDKPLKVIAAEINALYRYGKKQGQNGAGNLRERVASELGISTAKVYALNLINNVHPRYLKTLDELQRNMKSGDPETAQLDNRSKFSLTNARDYCMNFMNYGKLAAEAGKEELFKDLLDGCQKGETTPERASGILSQQLNGEQKLLDGPKPNRDGAIVRLNPDIYKLHLNCTCCNNEVDVVKEIYTQIGESKNLQKVTMKLVHEVCALKNKNSGGGEAA